MKKIYQEHDGAIEVIVDEENRVVVLRTGNFFDFCRQDKKLIKKKAPQLIERYTNFYSFTDFLDKSQIFSQKQTPLKAVAICSSLDEFDEEYGKKVAYNKLYVKAFYRLGKIGCEINDFLETSLDRVEEDLINYSKELEFYQEKLAKLD